MLTTEIKRKIDSARDILVGKVPDPKAQVDQITNALIYKFMDDMDQEAIDLGGKPQFFNNGYEKYSWSKLMDPKLGGIDRLDLYVEAVTHLSQNPHIPQLFRDIFKDAYLPYRDPETLSLFLKQINEFTYHHSEELGNSFEYLLSVLGSQGDAGQFRTPRHIIDFIVSVVDPKKTDRILDPACGTAGFLISAYKHILNSHDGKDESGKSNDETRLTPDERKRLANSIFGYDISPDMVKLSRVNMYLHGFPEPHIYEYDSLTSDDRWDDSFDVILANPPFMTPKGGIRPHKRFSVQANRAEVLFVDYIAEHLSSSGRAGIIVPEGVVFQSGSAYKQLRKTLVENYLYAVVSLPAGVFLPYSGVKTSILFFDKTLSKHAKDILFVDVEQVGVSLGASRKTIPQNDLIDALSTIRSFHNNPDANISTKISHSIPKEQILSTPDISLAGGRYRNYTVTESSYPLMELGNVSEITKGKSSSTKTIAGDYPLVLTAEEFKSADHYDFDAEAVCVPLISATGHGHASLKRVHYIKGKFALANLLGAVIPNDTLSARYLYWILSSRKDELAKLMRGAANVSMKPEDLRSFMIPVPPLELQIQISSELDGYEKIVQAAETIVENYKPSVDINPEWPRRKLAEVATLERGVTYSKDEESSEGLKLLRANNIDLSGTLNLSDIKHINPDKSPSTSKILKQNDIFICLASGSKDHVGKVAFIDSEDGYYFGGFMGAIRMTDTNYHPKFLYYILNSMDFNAYLRRAISGANINNLNGKILGDYEIPSPDFQEQESIVNMMDSESAAITVSKKLSGSYKNKITNKIMNI